MIGSRVGARLDNAGSLDKVYNRTKSKADSFAQRRRVAISHDIKSLVSDCDVIVSVLTDDQAVRDFIGKTSDVSLEDKTFIDMSTISPSTSVSISAELGGRGAEMLDVPVVGSANAVERGEAVLLVGGEKGLFESNTHLLHAIANEVVYVGPSGSGLRLKLIHNLVLASYVAALGEAIHFGLGGGLDPALIHRLLTALSSIRSPNSAIKVPKILNSDYSTQFSLKNMIKDLGIIEGEARLQGSAIPMGALAAQLYTLAHERGFSGEDFSVVAEMFKNSFGQKLPK